MTTRRGIILGSTGITAVIAGVLLLAVPPATPAQTAPNNLPPVSSLLVTSYQLISERRISRTVFDVTYRLSVRNTGPALIVVSGRASSTSTAVTFQDNLVNFGDIASGTPANSTDTFTVRHDRTRTFNPNQLAWVFTAAPGDGVPPDPGPANDVTVAGIDSDNDGVRDDVERWIAQTYPSSASMRAALAQQAHANQMTIIRGLLSPNDAALVSQEVGRAIVCGLTSRPEEYAVARKALLSETLNSRARAEAYIQYEAQLAGQSSRLPSRQTSCNFAPQSFAN